MLSLPSMGRVKFDHIKRLITLTSDNTAFTVLSMTNILNQYKDKNATFFSDPYCSFQETKLGKHNQKL